MKNSQINRFLSLFLALAMVFVSIAPSISFAAEAVEIHEDPVMVEEVTDVVDEEIKPSELEVVDSDEIIEELNIPDITFRYLVLKQILASKDPRLNDGEYKVYSTDIPEIEKVQIWDFQLDWDDDKYYDLDPVVDSTGVEYLKMLLL